MTDHSERTSPTFSSYKPSKQFYSVFRPFVQPYSGSVLFNSSIQQFSSVHLFYLGLPWRPFGAHNADVRFLSDLQLILFFRFNTSVLFCSRLQVFGAVLRAFSPIRFNHSSIPFGSVRLFLTFIKFI